VRALNLTDKFEVESGMLCLKSKGFVPTIAEDLAEQSAMRELHRTYGKVGFSLWVSPLPQSEIAQSSRFSLLPSSPLSP